MSSTPRLAGIFTPNIVPLDDDREINEPELRRYVDSYNKLADIYLMLRNAYGKKTTFIGEIAHKTEKLVREQ